jgi:hypothetical protein
MVNISILFPTRMRPMLYHRAVESCFSLADNPDGIEVICKLDYDDPTIPQYIEMASKYKNTKLYISDRKNGYLSWSENMNYLGRMSVGNILMQLNDDAYILTKSWDTITLNKALEIKDNIFNFTHNAQFPNKEKGNAFCFPTVSRKVFDIIGISPHQSSDYVLFKAFSKIKRCFHLENLVLCHDHILVSKDEIDTVSKEGCLKWYSEAMNTAEKSALHEKDMCNKADEIAEILRSYIL